MKKVSILGAGISGLSAGINLAKAGYKVDIFERAPRVGHRFHNDLQGLENWSTRYDLTDDLESMNISNNFYFDPCSKCTITDGKKDVTLKGKRPFFYLIKRGTSKDSLDNGLMKQAVKAGVRIRYNTTTKNPDITATGPIMRDIYAADKGIIFKTDMEDSAIMLLDNDAAYMGYAYLLVSKGYGCMCTVTFQDLKRLNNNYKKTEEYFRSNYKFKIKDPRPVSGVGSFLRTPVYTKGRSRLVGESAGLQDCLFGFGMRYALSSGYLAAQSITEEKDYTELASKHFNHKLKASIVNRYIWERLAKKDYSSLMSHLGWAHLTVRSFYNYNLLQKMLFNRAVRRLKQVYPMI